MLDKSNVLEAMQLLVNPWLFRGINRFHHAHRCSEGHQFICHAISVDYMDAKQGLSATTSNSALLVMISYKYFGH